jgi:hypothetical protein
MAGKDRQRHTYPGIFARSVSDEEKKFYSIDTRTNWRKTGEFLDRIFF